MCNCIYETISENDSFVQVMTIDDSFSFFTDYITTITSESLFCLHQRGMSRKSYLCRKYLYVYNNLSRYFIRRVFVCVFFNTKFFCGNTVELFMAALTRLLLRALIILTQYLQ